MPENTYKVRYVKCPYYSKEGRYADKGVAIMPRADGSEFCTCCGGINTHQVPLRDLIAEAIAQNVDVKFIASCAALNRKEGRK